MKKILVFFTVLFIGLVFIIPIKSFACVGKTIYIGQENNPESAFLAEIVVTLIKERTGTTAVIKVLESGESGHNLLEKGTIDILIESPAFSLVEILKKQEIPSDVNKIFDIVRDEYQENLNLVWMRPFGFNSTVCQSEKVEELGLPCYPAPVVRKDTLKKFPALPRLLNKLGGIIDDKAYNELSKEINEKEKSVAKIARNFLKAKNLI